MTIYLDIILLENIIMNYIILLATGIISKATINKIRILLASILGAIYSVVSFTIETNLILSLIIKILLSITIIYIAFKPQKIKKFLKQISIFYLTTFAYGGCAIFLLYYIKPQDILIENGIYIGTYPIKVAVLGGILGFIIINIVFKLVKGKLEKNNMYCKLIVELDGKEIETVAMIDSGNLLKEPITKVPVVVIEKERLREIIDKELLDNVQQIITAKKIDIPDKYISSLKVIPFTSLGKQNGMLLGLKVDKIEIEFDEEKNIIRDVIIGIYEGRLCKDNKYSALIGLELLK